MSIDLDIFPTSKRGVCWRNIEDRLQALLGASSHELLGDHPALWHLSSHTVMGDDDNLTPNNSYYFALAVPNTLILTVMPNQGNLDEHEYLEDYGRNLAPVVIQELANRWHKVGYYYELTSMMGRSKPEPELLIALTSAIADVCSGYIIVMNDDIFDLGVGIYTSEQFRQAHPKF
jgi:hypothetical protein